MQRAASFPPVLPSLLVTGHVTTGGDPADIGGGAIARFQGMNAGSVQSQLIRYGASTGGPTFYALKSRGATVGSTVAVQANDILGTFAGGGFNGSGWASGGNIRFEVDGVPATSMPGRIVFGTTGNGANVVTDRLVLTSDGTFRPVADNAYTWGAASFRIKELFVATGTINTSDAREKTAVRALTAAEIAAAKDLAREIGAYQFLAAVAEKGDAARQHVGMTVQRAMEVMQGHGLDPLRYGFICYDAWDESVRRQEAEYGEATETIIPAGDRYSFRPDELLMFLARGFEARLAVLEGA